MLNHLISTEDNSISIWRPDNGPHLIKILTYVTEEGPRYTFEYLGHYFPEDGSIVCPRTWNENCPICDFIEISCKGSGMDFLDFRFIRAKKRSLYNVVVLDTKKEEKLGVQILDISSWFAERNLLDLFKELIQSEPPEFDSLTPELEEVYNYISDYVAYTLKAKEVADPIQILQENYVRFYVRGKRTFTMQMDHWGLEPDERKCKCNELVPHNLENLLVKSTFEEVYAKLRNYFKKDCKC